MTTKYLFAVFHLLGLAIGLAAVYARWRALRQAKEQKDIAAVLHADSWYGLAALIWIGTGLMRAFGGLEKGTAHYLGDHWFIGKMTLFLIVLCLEIKPMSTFMGWRAARGKTTPIDLSGTGTLATLTLLQLPLLVLMVFMAAAMARGL
ncbi:MAG: DUF2214 family protein [Flavobacteriales bacterium]|nr:DUF2214 family protein [Flavobacteriales bacterium]